MAELVYGVSSSVCSEDRPQQREAEVKVLRPSFSARTGPFDVGQIGCMALLANTCPGD